MLLKRNIWIVIFLGNAPQARISCWKTLFWEISEAVSQLKHMKNVKKSGLRPKFRISPPPCYRMFLNKGGAYLVGGGLFHGIHLIIKPKRKTKLDSESFYFFEIFRSKQTILFSKNLEIRKIRNFEIRFFQIVWFFEKLCFVCGRKICGLFFKSNSIFRFVFIMSSWCPIFKSADRLEIGLRCLRNNKSTFLPNISIFGVSFEADDIVRKG